MNLFHHQIMHKVGQTAEMNSAGQMRNEILGLLDILLTAHLTPSQVRIVTNGLQ